MPAVTVRPAWQTYADDLIVLGHGLALWEPAPLHNYDKVNIGDVGYIRDGRFHLLFSAALPLGNRQLGVDVPRSFVPIGPGPIVTDQPRLPGALHTEHVEQYGGGLRASSDISCIQAGTNLRFQSSSKQGAILLTKYKTFRTNAERLGFFKDYMLRNYHSWVDFANQLGHMVNCEDVLLVTGHDMTLDFAMLAFSSNSRQIGMEFEAGLPAVASAAASVWGTWRTTMSVHHNCGPQHREPPQHAQPLLIEGSLNDSQPDYNQCVFLRGYRIRKRAGLIPTVIKAAAGPHDLGSGHRFDEHGSMVSRQDRPDSDSDVVIVSDTPPFIDPLDPLFRYIFEHSSAEVAVLHDLDVPNLMEATGTSSADMKSLVAKLSPKMIEVGPNGTAYMKALKTETLSSLPESTVPNAETSQSGRNTDDAPPENPAAPRSLVQLEERPQQSTVGYGSSPPENSLVQPNLQPGPSPSYSLHNTPTIPWSKDHMMTDPQTDKLNDRASLQLSLSRVNRSTTSIQSRMSQRSNSTCPSSLRTGSIAWNPVKVGLLRRFGRGLERRAESVVIRAYLRSFEKRQPTLLSTEGQFPFATETEVQEHCAKLVDLCVAGMPQEIRIRAFTFVLSGFKLPLRRLWSTHVAEAISRRKISKVQMIFKRGFFALLEGNTSGACSLVDLDVLGLRCPAVAHEIAIIISHLSLKDSKTDPVLDPRSSVGSFMRWSSQRHYLPKTLSTFSMAVIRAGFLRLAKHWGDKTLPYWDLRGLECLESAFADISHALERHGNLSDAKEAKMLLRKLQSKRLILGDEEDDVLGALCRIDTGLLELSAPSSEATYTEIPMKAYDSTPSHNRVKHPRDRQGSSIDSLTKRLLPASSNKASWGDHKKEKTTHQT